MRRKKITDKTEIKKELYIKLEKKFNIAIIVPVSSKNRSWRNINQCFFINTLLNSFIKTCSNENNYNFYLGYDDDDNFFINNKNNITTYFNNITGDNYSIKFIVIKNLKNKVGKIWSLLADIAREENEYIYQLGDDIQMLTKYWDNYFINRLISSNNFGCVGPLDLKYNSTLVTQSFVHIKHLEIFKNYFPDEIFNWKIDNWICYVYGAIADQDIKIINKGGVERYFPKRSDEEYRLCKNRDSLILSDYLNNFNKLNIYDVSQESNKDYDTKNILLTVGIPTLESRKNIIIRLLNKIKWSGYNYLKNIEIIIYTDNKENSVGYKRNIIVNNASGKYFCFIDDDDIVSDFYFEEIFKGIEKNVDGIGWKGLYYEKERCKMVFCHSFENKNHFKRNNIQYRPLNHLNTIRTSIMKQVNFPSKNCGEDFEFTNKLLNSQLIKTHYFIDKILYHYLFDKDKTETQK